MSHKTDAKRLKDSLVREGFEVSMTGSGHWEVRTRDGERITTFPQTPSDRRWKANALGAVRRWKRQQGIPLEARRLPQLVPIDTHGGTHQEPSQAEEYKLFAAPPVTVQPGQTLSGIAAANGVSLGALEAANPQIVNPDLIFVGEKVVLPSGGSFTAWTSPSSSSAGGSPSTGLAGASAGTSSSSSGGIDSIPGVPSSFVACVAYRESTNGTNQAYNGGVYGIITASGYDVNGQSLAAQKAAFQKIYDTTGPKAWAADGCPGT